MPAHRRLGRHVTHQYLVECKLTKKKKTKAGLSNLEKKNQCSNMGPFMKQKASFQKGKSFKLNVQKALKHTLNKNIHLKFQLIISIQCWNTSVCSIRTPNCERKQADIHEYWYVLCLPLVVAFIHNLSLSTGVNGLLQWHKFVYFCLFFVIFFKIFFFSYFLSRLKQVSLSLELEMRYTTAPFALLVLHTSSYQR